MIYTRKNPNGTFRIPAEHMGDFRISQHGSGIAMFGDAVNRLGEYESLLSIQEAKEYARKKIEQKKAIR